VKELVLALAITLPITFSFAAPPGVNAENGTLKAWNVQVAVVLEGVRYEAAAFNALLYTGTLHIFDPGGDTVYAFTSVAAVRTFADSRRNRTSKPTGALMAPATSHGCDGHLDALQARYYDGYSCDALMFTSNPDNYASNLHTFGYGDRLSSIACAYDGTYTQYCVVWENIDFAGSSVWYNPGGWRNDFRAIGFDNMVSSFIHYTHA
jgi:hypothetical protein